MTFPSTPRAAILFACGVSCLLAPSSASALDTIDAWLRPQDSFELRLDSRWGTASRQFDENGTSIRLVAPDAEGSVGWFDVGLTAQYGLFQDLTVELGTIFRRARVRGPSSTAIVSGIGDFEVGVAYNLFREAVDLSLVIDTSWPTGYTTAPGRFVPSLGEGAAVVDVLAAVGRRYEAPFEFTAAAGYRYRGNRVDTPVGSTNLADQLVMRFEATFDPRDDVRVETGLDGAFAFSRPNPFDSLELRPEARDYLNGSIVVSTPFQERFRAGVGYQRTLIGLGALQGQSLLITLTMEETL